MSKPTEQMALVSAYAKDPSPRKAVSTGLIVMMVIDENDTCHRASAVEMLPTQQRVTWDKAALGTVSPLDGEDVPSRRMPKFAFGDVSSLARIQLQFNVWFHGRAYSNRWFQVEFAINALDADPAAAVISTTARPRQRANSGAILGPWRDDADTGDDHLGGERRKICSFPVLSKRGMIHLTYAAVQYYDASQGEVIHMVVDEITLELLDTEMFARFLAYRGHRLTCAIGKDYLYRANLIEDTLPVKVETSTHSVSYVETKRQRSSASNSVDSADDEDQVGRRKQLSSRRYVWKARSADTAAFPSVRDGHKPAGPEELFDLSVIDSVIKQQSGSLIPQRRTSRSCEALFDTVDGLSPPRVQKEFVPDNPDFSNTRFRLPYVFEKRNDPLVIRVFDFRTMPPTYLAISVSWMDFDQEIIQEHLSIPRRTSVDDQGLQRRQRHQRAMSSATNTTLQTPLIPKLSTLLGLRRRNSTSLTPDNGTKRAGKVTKWISDNVKLTILYSTRPRNSTSVDIDRIELDVADFDSTLQSTALWGSS